MGEVVVNASEGQKRWIAIARALIKDPDIIMDEPISTLDNRTRNSFVEVLKDAT
jgi:ABC-type multidrug transport system ATPase subunit